MRLRVIAAAVARVIEHRRRRRRSGKRPIVAHIDPTSPGVGLALGQHRHGCVVAVQPFGGEDVLFDAPEQRRQHRAAAAHLIGQGRQAERHTLTGIAIGWRFNGWCCPNFSNRIIANRLGPAQPRARMSISAEAGPGISVE